MYCIQCGAKLPDMATYCPNCGFKVNDLNAKGVANQKNQETKHSKSPQNIPAKKGRVNSKAPPKISLVTLFFALVGLILILVLLNPWHSGQEKPSDFEGTLKRNQNIGLSLIEGTSHRK